jgi:hydrogenase maturation factor
MSDLDAAGNAILSGIGASASDQLSPKILYHEIIEDLADQHALILNRSRDGSILIPGVSLLIYEMTPALFACVAANEAEKVAPNATINDVQMMGASGRIFMSGTLDEMKIARDRITEILSNIKGRPVK